MKNKLILLSSAVLVIIVGFFFLDPLEKPATTETQNTPTQEVQQNAEQSITVTIDYEGNETISQNYSLKEEDTAFSVLEKITMDKQIPLETEQYDFGVFVKSINGLESTAEMSWIYFVNGESGQVAADKLELSAGDSVEWKYIEPEY